MENKANATNLLAEAAVNALGHVDIVTSGTTRAIQTRFGLNSDGLSGADGFAKLASNAAFLTGGVTSEGMLTTEARRERGLFERIVEGDFRVGPLFGAEVGTTPQFGHERTLSEIIDS